MADDDAARVLRSAYEAFRERDLDTLGRVLADDILWHVPGRNQLSGDITGRDQVLDLLRRQVELSDGTFRPEIHEVIGSGEHAVGLIRVTGEREGRSLDVNVTQVVHVHDGRITELWAMPADQYAVDEFWG
jgi:uncharacterized protein